MEDFRYISAKNSILKIFLSLLKRGATDWWEKISETLFIVYEKFRYVDTVAKKNILAVVQNPLELDLKKKHNFPWKNGFLWETFLLARCVPDQKREKSRKMDILKNVRHFHKS